MAVRMTNVQMVRMCKFQNVQSYDNHHDGSGYIWCTYKFVAKTEMWCDDQAVNFRQVC